MKTRNLLSLILATMVLVGGYIYADEAAEAKAKAEDSEKKEEKAIKPVNAECPYSGDKVNKKAIVAYGFCCNNCKGKFEADPAKYIAKVKTVAENSKCPMSGEDVDPEAVVVVKGTKIGFCCDNCKSKFAADPDTHMEKVKFDRKTVNAKCPMSGKDIDPKAVFAVGFCCKNCKGKFKSDPKAGFAKFAEQ